MTTRGAVVAVDQTGVIFSVCCRSWMASPIWRLMAWAAGQWLTLADLCDWLSITERHARKRLQGNRDEPPLRAC